MSHLTYEFSAGTAIVASQVNQNFNDIDDALDDKLGVAGGTLTGSLSVGGNLTADGNTLKVDSVANRVGVLTTTPTCELDVTGEVKASSGFTGDLTGAVQTAAQPNITSVGVLTVPSLTVNGAVTVTGNVDGRDVAADGTKLDGVESGATADQTLADIKGLGFAKVTVSPSTPSLPATGDIWIVT